MRIKEKVMVEEEKSIVEVEEVAVVVEKEVYRLWKRLRTAEVESSKNEREE